MKESFQGSRENEPAATTVTVASNSGEQGAAAAVVTPSSAAGEVPQETSFFAKFTGAVKEFTESKKQPDHPAAGDSAKKDPTAAAAAATTSTTPVSDGHDSTATAAAGETASVSTSTSSADKPQPVDRNTEKNTIISKISLAVKELLMSTQGFVLLCSPPFLSCCGLTFLSLSLRTNEVNEATPQFERLVDELDALLRYGLKSKTQFFSLKSSPPSYWLYVVHFTPKGTVSLLEKQHENIQNRERAWVALAVSDNACVNYLGSFNVEPDMTRYFA